MRLEILCLKTSYFILLSVGHFLQFAHDMNTILFQDTFDNEIRVETSLPPAVQGQLRCFLAVRVDWIIWKVKNHPKDIQVCLQWWGETGNGTMFWYVSIIRPSTVAQIKICMRNPLFKLLGNHLQWPRKKV